ncbi:MAG TPA: hypothetical protein VEX38_03460 [Fimbriimonadaceae bacterium]|nr:hypothetical protein [Fimbriimonadaceae bacterium]
MNRPSKKDIKAAVDKLKDAPSQSAPPEHKKGELSPKKSSQRIRKQGV